MVQSLNEILNFILQEVGFDCTSMRWEFVLMAMDSFFFFFLKNLIVIEILDYFYSLHENLCHSKFIQFTIDNKSVVLQYNVKLVYFINLF